jgi:hypothetical protein
MAPYPRSLIFFTVTVNQFFLLMQPLIFTLPTAAASKIGGIRYEASPR